MHIITSTSALYLRGVLRRAGITRLLAKIWQRSDYEQALNTALEQTIRPGDIVWDVGANIGYYTQEFARRVGESGRVFAFEPCADNLSRLRAATASLANVVVCPCGLSRTSHKARFLKGKDSLGATSRVADNREAITDAEVVDLCAGDDVVSEGMVSVPDVLKIDVEGHELEVLEGLTAMMAEPGGRPRSIFIEVHFSLLAAAGQIKAPRRMQKFLEEAGFTIDWLDPSHVHAHRRDS
jgi:FkbM family methyltransferase